MTPQDLIKEDHLAISQMNRREFEKASQHWERILEVQPNWEHGIGAYSLAMCYEEMKKLEDAERLYREAIRQEPENEIFMGGYASFLYLYGKAEDALTIYVKLLQRARVRKDAEKETNLMKALVELGARLGLSASQLERRLLLTTKDVSKDAIR